MTTPRSLASPHSTNADHSQHKISKHIDSPCELHAAIHRSDSRERRELETYIHTVFARGYAADIKSFLPQLMSLRTTDGSLHAALGMHCGTHEPLFLETYLDNPVEQRLATVSGFNVQRDTIVEIGNLASTKPGASRWIFLALAAYLHGRGTEWAIYTVAPFLKNTFLKLGFNLHILAKADKTRLGNNAAEWGSYYDASPEVMAVSVSQAYYAVLHFVELIDDKSLLRLCADAHTLGMRSRA